MENKLRRFQRCAHYGMTRFVTVEPGTVPLQGDEADIRKFL